MESDGPEIGVLNELDLQSPESKSSKSSAFHVTLTQIQGKPLSPDNIDTYARDALADLIKLTDSIVGDYAKEQPSDSTYGKELEDKAFEHFGLGNLGEILNYVASKELELERIDKLIEGAENVGAILVPPTGEMPQIQEGDGSFGKKSVIARTKTLLFILSNEFDIDTQDPNKVVVKTGILSDKMMRKLSYFMINVPSLNRTILSCDEEGNVTYIFDNDILSSKGISQDDLALMTKEGINDLLKEDPKLGRRLIYTKTFVPRMINLITDLENNNDSSGEGAGLYLFPKAPEGILSVKNIAYDLGVDHGTVVKAIEGLSESLGEITQYRFGAVTTTGYTSEQQEMIRQELDRKGLFSDQAPEEVLSVYSLSKRLGVGEKSINKAIEELGDSLGEITQYRFGTRAGITGYTQKQQEMIKQALEEKGLFMEQAPEEVKPIAGIAKEFGVAHDVIKRTVNNLGETLGETTTYRFGNTLTAGYNSEQQEIIRQELEKRGLLSEIAPEGILSAGVLARRLNVDYSTLMNSVRELDDSLGETTQYRFGSAAAAGYTTEQQEMIRQELEKRGLLSEIAPEGILSLHGLSRKLHTDKPKLKKLIEELADSLGEAQTYKFGGYRPAIGYTEEQQEMIRLALEERRAKSRRPKSTDSN
ncbi:MAG: hypothetical protein AAB521_04780 [Patescibacteria group bacterium]